MEPGLLNSADWPILIDIYFFLGGIAGGAFVIATIANLMDDGRYRDIVRAGYGIAVLAILPCPILLIADLGMPSRFLNMLMVSKPSLEIGANAMTAGPFHLKPYSPMSAGAWGLSVFSACAFICAAETWLADRRGQAWPRVRMAAGIAGGVSGFFLAAYPGVLLGATARPLFINAHWLGALFLAVGAATGGAAIALVLGWLRGAAAGDAISRVMRVTSAALVVELAALALFVVSVTSAGSAGIDAAFAQLISGPYAIILWGGAVLGGAILPLLMQRSARVAAMTSLSAALVLAGGFLVKFAIIGAGQIVLNGRLG